MNGRRDDEDAIIFDKRYNNQPWDVGRFIEQTDNHDGSQDGSHDE
jgi:hypothetical protein